MQPCYDHMQVKPIKVLQKIYKRMWISNRKNKIAGAPKDEIKPTVCRGQ